MGVNRASLRRVGVLAGFVLAGAGFSGRAVPGGLYQRISLAIGLGWVTALMLRRR